MNRIAPILFALSILFSHHAFSQYFQSTNYREGTGLPSSETYSVFQDSKGFVWIGCDNGVVKYDGRDFTIYNTAKGLTDNTVFGFFEDYKGRIWFRTYNGALSYYENDTITAYKYNKQLKSSTTSAILATIRYDSLDELYFGTTAHAVAGKIDSSGNVTTLYGKALDEFSIPMDIDEQGRKWWFFGFMDKLVVAATLPPKDVRFLNIEGKRYEIDLDDRSSQRNWLLGSVKWKGKYYFSIHKNIFTYDGDKVEKIFTSKEPLISLYVDNEDRLWAGAFNSGAVMFTDEKLTNPFTLDILSELSVSSVMQDYEGGIWISTLDKGVFYFPNLTIRNYDSPDNSRLNTVVCGSNQIFLGNYGGNVFSLNEKGEIKLVTDAIAPISALFSDSHNNLWIGDGGGTHIHQTGESVIGRDGKHSASFKVLTEANDYLVAANSMGIFKISHQGKIISSLEERRRPTALAITKEQIYVGGVNGLETCPFDFSGKTVKITDSRVSSLKSLNEKLVAVGTLNQGLFVYDEEKRILIPIPVADVVTVNSMDADWVQRKMWIGTDKGLFQLNFAPDGSEVKLIDFSKADGLSTGKINSVCRMGNSIWAISDIGISSVPLDQFGQRTFVPNFYINRILFKDKAFNVSPGILKTEEEDVVIDVRPITFKGYSTFFRYRINEDQPWTNVTGGSIFLTDLKPDTYKIEIQASSGNNDWTKERLLELDILSKWWQTWTFKLSAVFAIVMLGYLGYWLRMNTLKRRQKYLELINLHQQKLIDSEIRTQERERKRIASDLHDGIGATLSSIKLQVSGAMNSDSGEILSRAKEINDNLTDVIDDIKRIVYDLHPPGLERYGLQVGLKSLADRLNKTSDVIVIFDYYGRREIMQPISITIYRILQELINNTLKHARASEIRIHINEFDHEINIMYEDNGIGMIGSRFTGLGLHSIESRVRSLNGRMTWESNHKGTFYNFDIPF